jgi:Zn finger protein HypA/HybF involved in hydrogenase expression
MHEEALLADLRRKIEELARANGGARIVRVHLWVGALSHFTEAHLRQDWPRVVQGTAAETAELEVETSEDPHDPRAQRVVLTSLGLE